MCLCDKFCLVVYNNTFYLLPLQNVKVSFCLCFNLLLVSDNTLYLSPLLGIETPEEHGNRHDENSIEIDQPPLPGRLK